MNNNGTQPHPVAQDAEAETFLVAAMLQSPLAQTIAKVEQRLQPFQFHQTRHELICESIYRILDSGKALKLRDLSEDLHGLGRLDQIGGTSYIKELFETIVDEENVAGYAARVQASSLRRKFDHEISVVQRQADEQFDPQKSLEALAAASERFSAEVYTVVEPPRPRFSLISAPAFKLRPPPKFLVDNLLVENTLSALIGPSGTFKSFMAMDIAACVAAGIPWSGRQVRQGPVVYISGEGSAGLSARIRAWEIVNQIEMPECMTFLAEAVQISNEEEVNHFIAAIKARSLDPSLIIVDTIARCLVGQDENSARDVGLYVAGADRLRNATGAHVLSIHHVGKSGDARGSTALPGALDTQIGTRRERDNLTLFCKKQKDHEEFADMGFVKRVVYLNDEQTETSLIFDPADVLPPPVSAGAMSEKKKAVLDLLDAHPKGIRASPWQKEAVDKLAVGSSTFYDWRDDFVLAGHVVKEGSLYFRHYPELEFVD